MTLVNFWAINCSSCVAEIPKIVSTYEKYKSQGFDTIAVTKSYGPSSYAVIFAQTRYLPFNVQSTTPLP